MSEVVIPVPAEWKRRAFIDAAKYEEMYQASIRDPEAFWAQRGAQARMDHAVQAGEGRFVRCEEPAHQVVLRWIAERLGQLPGPPPENTRRPDRDHLGSGRSESVAAHLLRRAASRSVALRQRAESERRTEGRPRHDLSADDPGSGLRDARLRAHRRRPFGGVRRVLAGLARRPHPGLRKRARGHGG